MKVKISSVDIATKKFELWKAEDRLKEAESFLALSLYCHRDALPKAIVELRANREAVSASEDALEWLFSDE